MKDASSIVAALYAGHPYPAPETDLVEAAREGRINLGDPAHSDFLLWPEGRPRSDLHILSAGCGTNQAAMLAHSNPRCQVVGVDLSAESLAHERYLQEKYGLSNLRLYQGDLRDVGRLGMEFDLILCTGVVHHMTDPVEGLAALASVLSPQGAMLLMVYAAYRRAGVYIMQDVFRRLEVGADADGVAFVKAALADLHPQHPVRYYLSAAQDLGHDSGIVDTFLHPVDRAFTVSQVLDLVDRAGLRFQSWVDNYNYYPTAILPRSSELRRRIEALPEHEQWSVVEGVRASVGSHFFLAAHPARSEAAYRLNFDGDEWLDYTPKRHPLLRVVEPADAASGRPASFDRMGVKFMLPAAGATLIALCDGTQTVREIISGHLSTQPFEAARSALQTFFLENWRSGHLYFRKA